MVSQAKTLGKPGEPPIFPVMTAEDSPNLAIPADPDAESRDRLADAVAAEAAFEGWSRAALQAASRRLELPPGEAGRLFPGGPIEVLTFFSERADRRTVVDMEAEGVASLKIRHHAQLGFVIEAPAAAVEALRDVPELTLRQGMASGARFTHPELTELDRRISAAGERAEIGRAHV